MPAEAGIQVVRNKHNFKDLDSGFRGNDAVPYFTASQGSGCSAFILHSEIRPLAVISGPNGIPHFPKPEPRNPNPCMPLELLSFYLADGTIKSDEDRFHLRYP